MASLNLGKKRKRGGNHQLDQHEVDDAESDDLARAADDATVGRNRSRQER